MKNIFTNYSVCDMIYYIERGKLIMSKKLYRVEEGRMICGVCAGVGEYFNVDPTLVRLGFVLFSALGGSGLLVYFVAALLMPMKPGTI